MKLAKLSKIGELGVLDLQISMWSASMGTTRAPGIPKSAESELTTWIFLVFIVSKKDKWLIPKLAEIALYLL